ncbi:MAG: FecR domain-containing protein, partial [Planctomycetota bacterium]
MSGAPDAIFERVAELTELYLRDEISDDQLTELEMLILESEQGAQAIRTVLKQAGTMRVVFNEQREFVDRIGEVDRDEYLKLLQTLSPAEEPEAVNELGHLAVQDNPTKQDIFAACSYLFEYYVTPRLIGTIAAAAVLLLGVVLTVVLLSGNSNAPDTAQLPDVPDATSPRPNPNPNRVVATVTDQVNAQWVITNGRGALPDRLLLAENQRLTLTKGFAEITTNRGAKVLVQAPATFETTDSDNAIRLHRGKLVGICETPNSKGFTVHAPGMDVVDLGTRFGVEADAGEGSTVLVMEGSVRAEPTPESPLAFEAVLLERDDARRIEPETGLLETITAAEVPVFYNKVPHPYVTSVLDAKPLAYWRFESDADNTVINAANPKRHPLSVKGSAALDNQGLIGRAGRLGGVHPPFASFQATGQFDELAASDAFTISCWFKLDHVHHATLLSFYDRLGDEADFRHIALLEVLEGDNPAGPPTEAYPRQSVRGVICDPPRAEGPLVGQNLFSQKQYEPGVWHHVAMVKNGDHLRLYLDGMPAGSMQLDASDILSGMISLGLTPKSLINN